MGGGGGGGIIQTVTQAVNHVVSGVASDVKQTASDIGSGRVAAAVGDLGSTALDTAKATVGVSSDNKVNPLSSVQSLAAGVAADPGGAIGLLADAAGVPEGGIFESGISTTTAAVGKASTPGQLAAAGGGSAPTLPSAGAPVLQPAASPIPLLAVASLAVYLINRRS